MTYQDQLSQRMAATGMDGYAATADAGWDMALAWRSIGTLTEEAASTFSEWSGAIDRATRELARLWAVPTTTTTLSIPAGTFSVVWQEDPDAWTDDAYSEEGGEKGGSPDHPYIAVMRDIDAVLAEPSEPLRLSWTYDEGASIRQSIRQYLTGPLCTGWVDENGVIHIHGGFAQGGHVEESWIAHTAPTRTDITSDVMPIAAPESPQERALRLRRCRGTGPARPSATEAHRPRRHT